MAGDFRHRRSILKFVVAIATVLVCAGAAFAEDRLRLVTASNPPLTTDARGNPGILNGLLGEAFGRLGHTVEIVRLPPERALKNADSGIDDGDAYRVAGLERFYPNLIRVPESVMTAEFVGYVRRDDITAQNWSDLGGYNVGIITGWKILDIKLKNHSNITRVKNSKQLFGMLDKGRVDVIIYAKMAGLAYLNDENMAGRLLGIKPLSKPFSKQRMFVYLNKKHQDLVVPLAFALGAMKEEGIYESLMRKICSTQFIDAPLIKKYCS